MNLSFLDLKVNSENGKYKTFLIPCVLLFDSKPGSNKIFNYYLYASIR